MAGNGIQKTNVTTEYLENASSDIEDLSREYYQAYTEFLNLVSNITTNDWRGDDASAFKNKVESFQPDFEKMNRLMDSYAVFLQEAANSYLSTQRSNMDQIGQLQGGSGT